MAIRKLTKPFKTAVYKDLKISSPAFDQNGMIPRQYTPDGLNISPPVDIEDIPREAKSIAVIVDDPDAPRGTFCHWVVWNIPLIHHLRANDSHGTNGINDFGRHRYDGPCPPSGAHRYFFKVYALDSILSLSERSKKATVEEAIKDHIVGFGSLVGRYRRS